MNRRLWLIAVLLLVPHALRAEAVQMIQPENVDSSDIVEKALRDNPGRTSMRLEGAGKALLIDYHAAEDLELFITPLQSDGTYAPTDFLHFLLPKADEAEAQIDLTVSPGWSPWVTQYTLNVLAKSLNTDAGLRSAEFVPAGFLDMTRASVAHLFFEEPYTPSTYHALHGIRVLGTDVVPIFGILLLLIAGFVAFKSETKNKIRNVACVFFIGTVVYALRFSIDELRFTAQHLSQFRHGTYDEAGSVSRIAADIRSSMNGKTGSVYVCRDGTNFKEKLLRYFSYPIRVSDDRTGAVAVVVMDKQTWSFDDQKHALSCGNFLGTAEKIRSYPDSSVLFSVTK